MLACSLISKPKMELKIILTTLSIVLFFMLTPCASHLLDQVQSSHGLGDHAHKVSLHSVLPRKLKLNEAAPVKGYEDKELVPQKKQKKYLSGKAEQKGHASRGTRQEWVEGSDKAYSQFFTMDYSHVRRRRPIHNKSVPVGP